MSSHVRSEILASLEEQLPAEESARAAAHLRICGECREFELELRRNDAMLRRAQPAMPLPRLAPAQQPTWPRLSQLGGVAGAVLVIVVAVVVATALGRRLPASASLPPTSTVGSSNSPTQPSGPTEGFLAFLDAGASSSALILVDPATGKQVRREQFSGTITTPVVHASTGRLAFWRRASSTSGLPAELLIWDGGLRAIATVTDLPPIATIWSASGSSIYFTVGTGGTPPSPSAPTGGPPDRARLQAVDVATGVVRTLVIYDQRWPLIPVVANASSVAGFEGAYGEGGARYVVLTAAGTELRSQTVAEPYSTRFAADGGGGTVLGIQGRFESTTPSVLRVWAAANYGDQVARLEEARIESAVFWPGRGEALLTARSGQRGPWRLVALELATGGTRVLLTSDEPLALGGDAGSPLPIDAQGRWLILDRGVQHDLVLFDVADGRLAGGGRPIARPPGADPRGAAFVGFVQARR